MGLLIEGRAQNRFNIQDSITNYLKTLPDYEIWKDMFESSVGKTIIDLMSGISELLMFKLDGRLKEQYLFTALNRTSIYLIADMLGYNVNRKAPAIGTIDLLFDSPLTEAITIGAGTFLDGTIPLTILNDEIIPMGTTQYSLSGKKIQVVEGTRNYVLLTSTPTKSYYYNNSQLKTIGIEGVDFERIIISDPTFSIATATTEIKSAAFSLAKYTVDSNGVLIDLEEEISWVDKFLPLTTGAVIIRTYYNGGIYLLFGDETNGRKLSINDNILVQYLTTLGKDTFIARNTDLGKIVLPTIKNTSVVATIKVIDSIYGGSDEDSLEKLRYMLAGWHSTQDRAVTLNDWKYILLSYPEAVDAVVRKVEDTADAIFEQLITQVNNEVPISINQLIALQEAVNKSCCTVEVCVLTQNMIDEKREEWDSPGDYWDTEINKNRLLSYVEEYKMITTKALIFNPIYKHLEISFFLTVNKIHPSISNLHDTVYTLVIEYIYKLGKSFYLTELTKKIYDSVSEISRIDISTMLLDGIAINPHIFIELKFGEYLRTRKEDILLTISYS